VRGPLAISGFADPGRWNAFVTDSPFGHFFQTWEWGELQDGLGGRPHRIAAVSDGTIVGCAQVLVFDSDSRKFAYMPRGPVTDPDDECVLSQLVDAIVTVCAREGVQLVRIEPQWAFHPQHVLRLERLGFTLSKQFIMPLRTTLVDLGRSIDAIWSGFRSNTRNRVRLAEKLGVDVRVGRSDDIQSFIHLSEETTARHGRPANAAALLQAARIFGRRDAMRLYLARREGVDVAGIVVFLCGATATYLWGASSASQGARRLNPNQLLHWTAMQWARGRGCTTYDLFGIPDYDADVLEAEYGRQTGGMWNLYRFKRGFGGRAHRHLGTFDYRFPEISCPTRSAERA
jgi:peptidoglycan pentaglycine glycine transferase (the first glycine)